MVDRDIIFKTIGVFALCLVVLTSLVYSGRSEAADEVEHYRECMAQPERDFAAKEYSPRELCLLGIGSLRPHMSKDPNISWINKADSYWPVFKRLRAKQHEWCQANKGRCWDLYESVRQRLHDRRDLASVRYQANQQLDFGLIDKTEQLEIHFVRNCYIRYYYKGEAALKAAERQSAHEMFECAEMYHDGELVSRMSTIRDALRMKR